MKVDTSSIEITEQTEKTEQTESDESFIKLRRDSDAVNAIGVGNIADDRAAIGIYDHHVGASRDIHTA